VRKRIALLVAAVLTGAGGGCGGREVDPHLVRIGHFPSVTHAHGVVAHAGTRTGKGWFEPRLGEGMRVEWSVYPAGPSAMEALLAGAVDAVYVGPNPALNAYVRSKGREVRVLSGATRGGSALVVQGDGRIAVPADFKGKTVATPQLGNTQDVACRAWLGSHGLRVSLTGGDVTVTPTANPDQLALFTKGDLDAAWTVEPWVSRLEREAGGRVLVEEKDALTTVLVCSAAFWDGRRETADRLVAAHRELTTWLRDHVPEALAVARGELREETRAELAPEVLSRAWGRLRFDDAIARSDFEAFVAAARGVGFLDEEVPLDRLVVAK
jgi:NitT/TauT family transport system substrate-binding protein